MNTFDDKLQAIFMEVLGVHISQSVHNKLKALFEAEMLDIIGEDDTVSGHEPLGNTHAISNYRRQQQRAALKEKLGREDNKQPIWDALNNSDA